MRLSRHVWRKAACLNLRVRKLAMRHTEAHLGVADDRLYGPQPVGPGCLPQGGKSHRNSRYIRSCALQRTRPQLPRDLAERYADRCCVRLGDSPGVVSPRPALTSAPSASRKAPKVCVISDFLPMFCSRLLEASFRRSLSRFPVAHNDIPDMTAA
jgi:hypothetical protein